MRIGCLECWLAENPKPDDPDELVTWKNQLDILAEHHYRLIFWTERTYYEQHRDAWIRTGDVDELQHMVRHVGP
jgi:hypothetical protein